MSNLQFLLLVGLLGIPGGAGAGDHDCVPYEPTSDGGDLSSSWSEPNERDHHQFTVPDDAGGGYVTVTLTALHGDVVPWMNSDVSPPEGAAITSGAAEAGAQTITDVFEVAAGVTYDLEVLPWINAQPEEYPVDYTQTWAFTSRVDCYEPNDASPNDWPEPVGAARSIPIDTAIEATSIVGHAPAGIAGDRLFDWYEFTLAAPASVRVGTLAVPDDVQVGLRLFSAAGAVVGSTSVPALGETTASDPIALGAGTFYLEFFPSQRGVDAVRTTAGASIPSHFTSSYRLGVAMAKKLSCLDAIFCDGFESGDATLWSASEGDLAASGPTLVTGTPPSGRLRRPMR